MASTDDEFERLVQLEMERLRAQLGVKPPTVSVNPPLSSASTNIPLPSTASLSSYDTNKGLHSFNDIDNISPFMAAANLDQRSSYSSNLLDTPNRNRPTGK